MTDKTKQQIAERIKQKTDDAESGNDLKQVIEDAKEAIKNYEG